MSDLPQRLGDGETAFVVGNATYRLDLQINQTIRNISMLNPEAAAAMIESSKNQFAIPAQESTKQAVEATTQFKYRALTLGVSTIAMALATNGSAKWIALGIASALGTADGVQFLNRWFSERRKK